MRYDEFFAGVHEHIFAEPTRRALDALDPLSERDLGLIRAACECAGARVAPVAAYFGFLPRLGSPGEYVDITRCNDGHAALDTADHEAVCAFAIWRHRGDVLRTKVVVPPERYRPGRAPWQLEERYSAHPHARDDD